MSWRRRTAALRIRRDKRRLGTFEEMMKNKQTKRKKWKKEEKHKQKEKLVMGQHA